jgi:alpha-L-fucosidase
MKIIMIFLGFFSLVPAYPQKQDKMVEEWKKMHQSKEQALIEFNNAKFGMFIHWGIYSLPAGMWKGERIKGLGEWIMYHAQIPREEYKAICKKLNPNKFNADKWVKAAKIAGMKYIVAMPKHHDGFAMYDSKVTDYDIMDATSFKRDPMAELYKACQKYGIKFSIYYSHATDWMDGGDAGVTDYRKRYPDKVNTFPMNYWDPSPTSFTKYLKEKSLPQVRELLERFPGMQEIWFDVPMWMTDKQSFEFYKLVYDIQPICLVNSRVGNNFGDFLSTGDNEIPGGGKMGDLYWETPGTLNNTWGYKSYDVDWKSTGELLFWITEIASKGGNYLLNVGPTAEGLFPRESIKQLKEIGHWMNINGEAVYGTRKWITGHEGPNDILINGTESREKDGFKARFTSDDFWFTAKDRTIYVTSLKWPENRHILIKSLNKLDERQTGEIKSVQMLGCNEKLLWVTGNDGLHVTLPSKKHGSYGYVLKITTDK